MWRRHRDRIRGLVLSNTRAVADSADAIERRRSLMETAEEQGSSAVANLQIAGMMGKTARQKRPDEYDAIHRMMAQAPVAGIVGALEALIERPDSRPTLSTVDVPTLIIAGDEDVITPPKEARLMQALIPGSRLEILQHAGHLSNVERPAAFNTVVSEFVGSLLYN
jgi:pimeloyl-ACP methyl ester carboxylesterase